MIVFIVEELIRFCPPLMAVFSLTEVSSAPSAGIVPLPDRLSFRCMDILFLLLIDGAE